MCTVHDESRGRFGAISRFVERNSLRRGRRGLRGGEPRGEGCDQGEGGSGLGDRGHVGSSKSEAPTFHHRTVFQMDPFSVAGAQAVD